jgi:hypothetical protein
MTTKICGHENPDNWCVVCVSEDRARLRTTVEEITMAFALHSCPKSGGFCWLCEASKQVEAVKARHPAPK